MLLMSRGIAISDFPSILHPGEKGYFYGSERIADGTLDMAVAFKPRWDIKQSKEDRINFEVSDIELRPGTFGSTSIFGKLKNTTGESQSWAIISVVLYAKDGSLIGVFMTNVMEDMANGASVGFSIMTIGQRTLIDEIKPDMLGSYKVYAYPTQWQF